MIEDIIIALEHYYQDDEETLIECLHYLSARLNFAPQIDQWFDNHGYCSVCGTKMKLIRHEEVHDEVDGFPIEVLYESYCPKCGR